MFINLIHIGKSIYLFINIYFFYLYPNEQVQTQKTESHCFAQAALQCLFTGAIPLLIDTGTLTCFVSDLGRFTPP